MGAMRMLREVQLAMRESEKENLASGIGDYSEEQARQAVVHTRQELVLEAGL